MIENQQLLLVFGDLSIDELKEKAHLSLVHSIQILPWSNYIKKEITNEIQQQQQQQHLHQEHKLRDDNYLESLTDERAFIEPVEYTTSDGMSKLITSSTSNLSKLSWASVAKVNIPIQQSLQPTTVSIQHKEQSNKLN